MLNFLLSPLGFILVLALYAIGALEALIFYKNDRATGISSGIFATLGGLAGLVLSSAILLTGQTLSFNLQGLPLLNIAFNIDRLSAFFMAIISLIATVSSIYSLGYIKHYFGKYNIGTLGFFYNTFIAGLILVVTSGNALFFLIAWEIMSVASYFLVVYERHEEKNIRAGTLYFIMTHIGTACILLAFLLLYRATGSFDFSAMRAGSSAISPALANAVFVLALLGFGTKAGIVPLHIWLPAAHPAAPSHVSALMSGVMIKTGIYMFVRIFIGIMPFVPLWWGIVFLLIGASSAVLGVLYALAEHDIKKLLAYHSIENIGIILLGFGASLTFISLGHPLLATAALVAALYHTINHAVFKALLFLGAGVVVSATHTRNIEKYGGLWKYMPQTAFLFLIGSLAISALPPFNGFVSEWLTMQALFGGIATGTFGLKLFFGLMAGALALTGGLAAACFVKAFGVTFLARPRSAEIKQIKEASFSERFGMSILALSALLLGLFAGPFSRLLNEVVQSLQNTPLGKIIPLPLPISIDLSMFTIFTGLSISLIITYLFVRIFAGRQKISYGRTWDCGTDLGPRMEITATGFSRSIITVFKKILRPTRETATAYCDDKRCYFPKESTIHLELHDIYDSLIYRPLRSFLNLISEQTRKIQSGHINAYALYIFITLIGLLFYIAH